MMKTMQGAKALIDAHLFNVIQNSNYRDMSKSEPSVDDYDHHIIFGKIAKMPLMMVRIDVIVPILNLEGIEENLALDLHYSLFKVQKWPSFELKFTAKSILKKLLNNRDEVLEQVGIRIKDMESGFIVDDWVEGLSLLANWKEISNFVSWNRGGLI